MQMKYKNNIIIIICFIVLSFSITKFIINVRGYHLAKDKIVIMIKFSEDKFT
jgi:hypothetical protein